MWRFVLEAGPDGRPLLVRELVSGASVLIPLKFLPEELVRSARIWVFRQSLFLRNMALRISGALTIAVKSSTMMVPQPPRLLLILVGSEISVLVPHGASKRVAECR